MRWRKITESTTLERSQRTPRVVWGKVVSLNLKQKKKCQLSSKWSMRRGLVSAVISCYGTRKNAVVVQKERLILDQETEMPENFRDSLKLLRFGRESPQRHSLGYFTLFAAFLYLVTAWLMRSLTRISPFPHGTTTLTGPKQTVTFMLNEALEHHCCTLD